MKKLAVAGLAAAALAGSAPAAHAAPSPSGVLCGTSPVADRTASGPRTEDVDAGPLLWTDDTDPAVTYSGSVTCTVQVGAGTHAGADACVVTGPETPVAGSARGSCTYTAAAYDDVYVCTQVSVDGTTLYYDDEAGDWSTDPAARCAYTVGLDTSTEPVMWLVGEIVFNYCPVFALLLPPHGDVPGLIDCPPYGV